MAGQQSSDESIIGILSEYMVKSRTAPGLADEELKTKHHILDTIGAMVSVTTLEPGRLAIKYAEMQGGTPQAQVVGSSVLTNAVSAAVANGILAHSDETDDSHAPSGTDSGCAVVPAALARGEKNDGTGETLLKSVVLGYDVGSRVMPALRPRYSFEGDRGRGFASHAMGGVLGVAAAASGCTDLNPVQIRHLLSYTSQ